ncbi:MAG: PSD1 and planctomycete cytochrome C domain-containing protein [Opitutaceae bacterium]
MNARVATLLLLALVPPAASAGLSPEDEAFFESRIRPVLAEHCYRCHSAREGKAKGGLQLDTREALRRGGDSGPALVPGAPEQGSLLAAVRPGNPDLQMPPADAGPPLTPAQVADLEAWIRRGAPDPRDGVAAPTAAELARTHWAFQPPRAPAQPPVPGAAADPVDAFLRATPGAPGGGPVPEADARTLLRRVSYALTGLPPTPEETEAFAREHAVDPGAYARAVERLLASPAYGERWGRHWLDVARYADTQGYLVGEAERRFPFSHTYRDYVIRAFNADLPYDRFLTEQLAGDLLATEDDRSPLAALGFLTLGRRFLNNQNDIIDDRIDVVTRGLLGLTVACARCHDHKSEPVTMRDYYALHGIFASSEEPAEKPLLAPVTDTAEHRAYLAKRAATEDRVRAREREEVDKFLAGIRARTGDYLLGVHDSARLPPEAKPELFAGERKLNPEFLRRWREFLATPEASVQPVLAPWFALVALPAEGFAGAAADLVCGWSDTPPAGLDATVVAALAGGARPLGSLADVAAVYNRVFAAPGPARAWAETEAFPGRLPFPGAAALIRRQLDTRTAALRRELAALEWTEPGAPLRAMALVERAQPRDSAVLLRGNPANRGPVVPRGVPALLAGADAPAVAAGSGRRELARAVARADNPLTARVFVNRVWAWHFGEGLVRTPSDFGVRTAAPELRDLLDWLAADFMAGGWSVKRLQRRIVLSAAYRRAAEAPPATLAADPENRWLTRFPRRRLDFEGLRDTFLAVSGRLETRIGGLAEDLWREPFTGRRSVYGFIDRQNLPGVFRVFDFPNPDASAAQRIATTVPQQALFLLNSPFALETARALAARAEAAGPARLEALFRLVHQRVPDAAEREWAAQFLAEEPVALPVADAPGAVPAARPPLSRLAQLAQVLLLANETAFVD